MLVLETKGLVRLAKRLFLEDEDGCLEGKRLGRRDHVVCLKDDVLCLEDESLCLRDEDVFQKTKALALHDHDVVLETKWLVRLVEGLFLEDNDVCLTNQPLFLANKSLCRGYGSRGENTAPPCSPLSSVSNGIEAISGRVSRHFCPTSCSVFPSGAERSSAGCRGAFASPTASPAGSSRGGGNATSSVGAVISPRTATRAPDAPRGAPARRGPLPVHSFGVLAVHPVNDDVPIE